MVIWPYDVITVYFWQRLGQGQVKKGQILKWIFLHKSKFLTQNFLTIPNTGLCISSGILVFPLFLGVRTSQRGGSLKRIENSAFREPVTEASLISFAGGSRGRREKSRCPFPFTRLGTELTPPAALVLARTSEPQSFSIPEPLNDSAEDHQTVVRSPGGFRPVPDRLKEGGCLDSFSSILMQLEWRSGSFEPHVMFLNMLLKRACSPLQLRRHWSKKKQGIRPPLRGLEWVRNLGVQTSAGWPTTESRKGSGTDNIQGIIRSWTLPRLRSLSPGRHPDAWQFWRAPGRAKENWNLYFPRLPLDPPSKDIIFASVTCSWKAEFSICLSEPPLSDVRTPQNKRKSSVTELLQSPVCHFFYNI